jgi:N-acetylneuraminic acid mutarotase
MRAWWSLPLAAAMAAMACGGQDGSDDDAGASAGANQGAGGASTSGPATTGSGASAAGWTSVAAIAGGPRQENAVVALNGEIYVLGGFDRETDELSTVEAYDPVSNSWRDAPSLPTPLHHVNAAEVGGKIYVLGALAGGGFTAVGDGLVLDPALNGWESITPMASGTERGGAAVGVIGTKVYVAGGYRGGAVTDFAAYDTVADSWQSLPPLPERRDHLVGGVVDGVFFAVGGRDAAIEDLNGRVDAFDPAEGYWRSVSAMSVPRAGAASATLDGRIYVFGGEGAPGNQGVFPHVSGYDAATDAWTALPDMPIPRHGTGAAAINGVIYVPGGATKAGFGAVDTHEAFTP